MKIVHNDLWLNQSYFPKSGYSERLSENHKHKIGLYGFCKRENIGNNARVVLTTIASGKSKSKTYKGYSCRAI
jgi:hypothetical protein